MASIEIISWAKKTLLLPSRQDSLNQTESTGVENSAIEMVDLEGDKTDSSQDKCCLGNNLVVPECTHFPDVKGSITNLREEEEALAKQNRKMEAHKRRMSQKQSSSRYGSSKKLRRQPSAASRSTIEIVVEKDPMPCDDMCGHNKRTNPSTIINANR